MARDYYADIDILREDLRGQGEAAWADKLEQAVSEGATGTEILMAVRYQLNELLMSETELDKSTKELIESLIKDIGDVVV